MVRSLYLAAYRGVVSSSYFAPDVRTTYPYVHRPLVEFVLGVPRLTFWEPRSIRSGMRRALNGVLPPAILDRRCKGYAGSATTRGIRPLAAQLAGSEMNWRLVTMGYVDGMALRHAIQSVMGCSSGSSSFVTACIHMEAWLRTISVTRARYTAVAGGAWL
jgi:hypothetical protein